MKFIGNSRLFPKLFRKLALPILMFMLVPGTVSGADPAGIAERDSGISVAIAV